MFIRTTYALEGLLERLRLRRLPLRERASVLVLHLSSGAHLRVFLETALTRCPSLRIQLASHLGPAGARRAYSDLAHLEEKHGVQVCTLPEFCALGHAIPSDLLVLLYAHDSGADSSVRREFRRCLAIVRPRRRVIIDADGTIWPGETPARVLRKFLRLLLRPLAVLRDREERRLLRKRMRPEPGYSPEEFAGSVRPPDYARRHMVLSRPVRIEQCDETGTVIEHVSLTADAENSLYEDDYHAVSYAAWSPDWEAEKIAYQDRRWRNMTKVGVASGGEGARNALDIGCGTGLLCDLLSRKGYDATGIDRAKSVIAGNRERFPHCRFAALRVEELGEFGETFDLVTLSHVLEHVADERALLDGVRSLLAPEGRLYIEVPWMDRDLVMDRRPHWHRQRDHCREYSKRGLYHLVRGMGYDVLGHADSAAEPDGEPFQFLLARSARDNLGGA